MAAVMLWRGLGTAVCIGLGDVLVNLAISVALAIAMALVMAMAVDLAVVMALEDPIALEVAVAFCSCHSAIGGGVNIQYGKC